MFLGRKYILEDSYLCLNGGYTFLMSTMHHLCEPEDLSDCGDNTFFAHSEVSSYAIMLSFLLFLTFLIMACIASLQLDIIPSKPLLHPQRTLVVI